MRCILRVMVSVVLALVPNLARADLWTRGHGDIGVGLENGELHLHVHLHSGATLGGRVIDADEEYDASDVQIFVSGPSRSRPNGTQWDFLGGDEVWLLPQSSDAAKPFVGLATNELDLADWDGALTWRLLGFSGPAGANFSLFQTDSFGAPVPFMTTSNGISGDDRYVQDAGGHQHFVWAFTSEGIFDLELEISGKLKNGTELTDRATFTFYSAVPEPSSMALLGCTCVGLAFRSVRRRLKITAKV